MNPSRCTYLLGASRHTYVNKKLERSANHVQQTTQRAQEVSVREREPEWGTIDRWNRTRATPRARACSQSRACTGESGRKIAFIAKSRCC